MQKLTRRRLDIFLKKNATTERVLDIGSGGSSYATYFPNRVTVDIDPERHPEIVADAAALPFADASFEFILSTEMLEHVLDPVKVLAEMHRVLAPGGTLILTTRFVYQLHDAPHDYWRYTRPNLERLFSDFSEVTIEAEAGPFTTLGILLERISFQSAVRGGKFTKAFLLTLSRILATLDGLVKTSYGDIKRTTIVPEIISSGYYVVARK
jgi:SAM-dependent methyltransferase